MGSKIFIGNHMKNYNKYLYFILLISILTGCASTCEPRIEYKEKVVPVYKIPTPPKVDRIPLETDFLTEEQKQSLGDLAKAYHVDVVILLQYAKQLEEIIKKYDELSKKDTNITPINP